MKSVVRAGVRGVDCRVVFGLCALFATACVEGDPIPQDVIQRAEGVLLEGNTGLAPAVSPPGSASSANSSSAGLSSAVAPGASASGFAANGNPPVLPELNELGAEELDEDAIPEDAIPLSDYLAH